MPWAPLSVLDGGIVPLLVDGAVVEPELIGDSELVEGDVEGDVVGDVVGAGEVDPVSVVELLVPEGVCVVGLVAGSVDEVCATAMPMAVTRPVAAAPATQFNFLLM